MAVEYSSFAGWERNLKLSNGLVEIIITVEVGPRIISYRPAQGRSVFKLAADEAGKSKEENWKIRGGHRLWTAPEDFGNAHSLCYALDNSEVQHAIEGDFAVRVSNRVEGPAKIRREMVVRLAETTPKVTVEHRIIHEGGDPLEVAPWGAFRDGARRLRRVVSTRQSARIRRTICQIAVLSRGHSRISPTRGFGSVGERSACVRPIVRPLRSDYAIRRGGPLTFSATTCLLKLFRSSRERPILTSDRTLRRLLMRIFSNSRLSGH